MLKGRFSPFSAKQDNVFLAYRPLRGDTYRRRGETYRGVGVSASVGGNAFPREWRVGLRSGATGVERPKKLPKDKKCNILVHSGQSSSHPCFSLLPADGRGLIADNSRDGRTATS
jgi:hypothetical protein